MKMRQILAIAILTSFFFLQGCEDSVLEGPPADGQTAEIAEEPGLPLAMFPQVKTMSQKSLADLKELPETGVFLVGGKCLPYDFKEQLASEGLTLLRDGSLVDSNGEKTFLFVSTKSFRITSDEHQSKTRTAAAGVEYYSIDWSLRRRGGVCNRKMVAKTRAYTWMKHEDPSLNHPVIVRQIKVSSQVGNKKSSNQCSNCSSVDAKAEKGIGCSFNNLIIASWHYGYWKFNNGLDAEKTKMEFY
jgi:hypothetical protein